MAFETILMDQENGVVVLTLNRPPVNVLNTTVGQELRAAFEEIDRDAAARAVIMTGGGERAFAAGADIRELQTLAGAEAEGMVQRWHHLFRRMETFRLPIIAAVNGVALGGGCELAMACDLRIASENARFGQPEINLGLIPGWGGTQRLPRLVGQGRAMELLMTGDPIDAAEACRIGLVNRVVPPDALMDTARTLARTLAGKGAVALRMIKACVQTGLNGPLDAGLAFEARQFGAVCATGDKAEGIAAFLEKRPPVFTGR
jgi:enoyl-CoA hydratase